MTSRKEECIQRAAGILLAARDSWLKAGARPAPWVPLSGIRETKGLDGESAEARIRAIVDRFSRAEKDHKTVGKRIVKFVAAIAELSASEEAIQRIEAVAKLRGNGKNPFGQPLSLALATLREAGEVAEYLDWESVRRTRGRGPVNWTTNHTATEEMCFALLALHRDWAGEPEPPYATQPKGGGGQSAWECMIRECLVAMFGKANGDRIIDGMRHDGTLNRILESMGGAARRKGKPKQDI